MFKKGKFLFGALTLTLGVLMILGSCDHNNISKIKPNQPDNPDNPIVTPEVPNAKDLIDSMRIESGNGMVTVLYDGQVINVKGDTAMQIVLKKGVEFDDATVSAKLGDQECVFSAFKMDYTDYATSLCSYIPGISEEEKELKVKVTSGNFFHERSFKLKQLDESTLQQDLILASFKIGEQTVDNIMNKKTYRLFDPASNKITFTAELSKALTAATIIINGKESAIELDGNKTKAIKEIEFEKNSVNKIAYIFQAEDTRDLKIEEFTVIFTNTVHPTVSVETMQGMPQDVHDMDLMSGALVYDKCLTTTPKIELRAYKGDKRKITKVTVDNVEVNIETKNPGDQEEYVATWVCNPPLEKAGESKEVKVHVEGGELDNSGTFKEKEAWDFTVKFTLVQFIDASLQIKVGAGNFEDLRPGDEKRVYEQSVKIRVVSKDDDLTDVVFKNYKDADGNVPEFEITGKEAVATVALSDTKYKPSELTIIAKAEGKTDTRLTALVRYTEEDDPLGVFATQFSMGDVEKLPDSTTGAFKMTKDRATVLILVGRNCKKITSIKIDDKEMLDKAAYSDPQEIVESAKYTESQDMGGRSVNAVIVLGKDDMPLDKPYTLNISLKGETDDGHTLSETKLAPLKFMLPDYGATCTDWRAPFGFNNAQKPTDSMEFLEVSKVCHKDDKAKKFYNYYGVQSFTGAVFPKNPRAKVKAFWYKHDTQATERRAILEAQEDDPKYAKNYITFKEVDTVYGKCKWGFTLNFEDADMQGAGIGVYFYVVAANGTTTNRGQNCINGKVNEPWEQQFRRLDLSCSFEKLGDDIGWNDANGKPGWNKAMQLTDELVLNNENWQKVKDNKLYFRATTFTWDEDMKYYLFREKESDSLPSNIVEFKHIDNQWNHDNRFTVDVSSLESGQSMDVEIPLWLVGKDFTAKVFTRKFKIKRE